MTSILLLVIFSLLSYLTIRRFAEGIFISGKEILAAAFPLGLAMFAAATSVIGIYLPTGLAAGLTFLGITAMAVYSFFSSSTRFANSKNILFELVENFTLNLKSTSRLAPPNLTWLRSLEKYKKKLFFFILLLIFSGFICFLVYNSFIVMQDGSISISSGASVDAPYHLAQVTRFGYAARLDFEEPNFTGEFIRYPFFINLISGILFKLTNSLGSSFNTPVFLLIPSGIFLLISLFRQLGLKNFSTMLALLISLFGGGLGYLGYFWMDGYVPLPIRNGMIWPAQNISYPGMIPGFLIVQRPFFLGLPLFLISLIFFIRGVKNNSPRSFIIAGIVAGLLPFSHMHSFLAMGLVIGAALAFIFFIKRELFYQMVRNFIFPVSFLALPQLAALLLLPEYAIGQIIKFRLGWMGVEIGGLILPHPEAHTLIPRLLHIWTNFGFMLIIPAFLFFYFLKNFKNKEKNIILNIIILGALSLWIIPNLIQFQVWDFDTNKFFAYAIILSTAACGSIIENFTFTRKKIAVIIFTLLTLLAIPSSFMATWRIIRNSYFNHSNTNRLIIFTDEERNAADWLRKNVSENSVLLTSSSITDIRTIQNPIAVAAGLKSSAGFMTWLYTHGIDFSERISLIKEFFTDPDLSPEFLDKVPADYLIVDQLLREKYPEIEKKIKQKGFIETYQIGSITIYDLKNYNKTKKN